MSATLRFGVIGRNIEYSRSKAVFEAVFRLVGVDGSFEVISCEDVELGTHLTRLRKGELRGLSVTVPFKNRVVPMVDKVGATAEQIEAVNSICSRRGKLLGFNTDVVGVSRALADHREVLAGGHALLIGSGGGARAVLFSLVRDIGVKDVTVLGRSTESLDGFRQAAETVIEGPRLRTCVSGSDALSSGDKFDIVINCTPLGGWNHAEESPLPEGWTWEMTRVYFDLNYNADNAAVAAAKASGTASVDGSIMLVAQALRSLAIWTGQTMPFGPVYEAVFGAGGKD